MGSCRLALSQGWHPRCWGDAKTLLEIGKDQISTLATRLQEHKGFLDRDSLTAEIQKDVQNEKHANGLARFISGIHELSRATGQGTDALIRQIEEELKKEEDAEKRLSGENLDRLCSRLGQLIKPYPGLSRQSKAQRLCTLTGCPLEAVEIVCDLRPVFNEDRTAVEGMIPYTTLRIVQKGADGFPVATEAILSNKSRNLPRRLRPLRQKLST